MADDLIGQLYALRERVTIKGGITFPAGTRVRIVKAESHYAHVRVEGGLGVGTLRVPMGFLEGAEVVPDLTDRVAVEAWLNT